MKQQVRAPRDHLIGSVLLGRYRVVRELAKGGMGVVYLARAEGAVGFVKPVVIKLLLPEHAQDDRFVGMFVREAKILSQLRHPSLVDVIEFGEQDGAYVLVLEYVRGYHLGQWLRFLSMKKRAAPPEVLIQIMIDVLEALHHAHELQHPDGTSMQIVHRDVSPSNILLDEDGRARLLDFGVARMRGGSHDYKTQVNGFMGKMPYTAPEMFSSSEASPKSDLYACGVVLHEALLGRNVFRAEQQAATLHKVMNHVPEPVEPLQPDVPPGLDAVLGKAVMKSPAHRYADAREFAMALRRLQREQESDIRVRLATMLKEDFGEEMAQRLNIESLVHRDEAWRRLSAAPGKPGNPRRVERAPAILQPERGATDPLPSAPAAMGATVAHSPAARTAARLTPGYLPAPQIPEVTLPQPFVPAPSRPPPAQPSKGSDTTVQTRAPANTNRASPAAREADAEDRSATTPAPLPAKSKANAKTKSSAPPHPVPAANSRGMAIGLAVVGTLALIAIVLPLVRPSGAGTPQPSIRVVTLPSEPEVTQPVAPVAPQPTEATRPPVEPEAPVEAVKRTKPKRGPDAQSLTQAVRRQQPKLEACFKQHSVSLEGQPTTQLEFDLAASGELTRVALSPKALAGTALGECLLAVGRGTKFAAQPHAVSFAIPLTARRGQ